MLIQDALSHRPEFGYIRIVPESVTIKRELPQDANISFPQTSDDLQTREPPVLQTKSGVVRKTQTGKPSR